MKINLNVRPKSKKAIFLTTARWTSYGLLLLFFYSFSVNSLIPFAPPLILPLATAIALFEDEMQAGVFAIFCGFFVDMAGDRLFGFTAFWLLALCVGISLIKSHYLKSNFVNYTWLTIISCTFIAFVDFLFFHWLFEKSKAWIAFTGFIAPSMAIALLVSPIIYIIVRKLRKVFSEKEEKTLDEAADVADADED